MFLLHKEKIKDIPFLGGGSLQFQVGSLLNQNNEPVFRYTRSMQKVRSFYRITLQFLSDESHTPYVFDVIRSASAQLLIEADNTEAKQQWMLSAHPKTTALQEALETIYQRDIDETPHR